MYPNAILENLPAPASDHYPIQLICEPNNSINRTISRFKFENSWLVNRDFGSFVNGKWQSYGDKLIVDKLDMCASDLFVWNRTHFQKMRRDIDICRKKIDIMREMLQKVILCFLIISEIRCHSYSYKKMLSGARELKLIG